MKKSACIALIGSPNVGKSTLLNNLIGMKISIVTPKAQTTRNLVTGIYTDDLNQLVFIDTPGLFRSKSRFEKSFVKAAWNGVAQADIVVLIIDATKPVCENTKMITAELRKRGIEPILILNKIDIVSKAKLLTMVDELKKSIDPKQIFMISALKSDGVEELKNYLIEKAPYSEWCYEPDEITTASSRFLATEITREQLFLNLSEEVPYGTYVDIEKWDETDKEVKIYQVIYVLRDTHKNIVVGKQGHMIKKIGINARKELETLFEKKIHLFLHVKTKEDWQEKLV